MEIEMALENRLARAYLQRLFTLMPQKVFDGIPDLGFEILSFLQQRPLVDVDDAKLALQIAKLEKEREVEREAAFYAERNEAYSEAVACRKTIEAIDGLLQQLYEGTGED